MKRSLFNLATAVSLIAASFVFSSGMYESKRMIILAILYAAAAALPFATRRAADFAFAITLLSLGWLQSFPAWNHSAEIGVYVAFGALVLARAARSSTQTVAVAT